MKNRFLYYIVSLFLLIILPTNLVAQNRGKFIFQNANDTAIVLRHGNVSMSSIHFGYTYNIKDKENKKEKFHDNYHALEIGYTYTKGLDLYKIGYNLYGANEVMFNSKKVFTGPKIGANFYILLATIGNELICYSDFNKSTWVYKPYFAFSLGALRSSIGYNVILSRNKFNLNSASLSIVIPIYMRDKKRE